jgi:hypothetical protein
MAEFHTNGIYGNYDPYLAQLLNPAVAGQYTPGVLGPFGSGGIGTGYSGYGAGAAPNAAFAPQNPWAAQQQVLHPVQVAQQIAARQAVHAIQCAQALQQIVQHLAAQQFAQPAMGGGLGAGQIGQAIPHSYGWGTQNPMALQQQATPQFAPYLAAQQPGQFRQGWVN